MLLDSGSPAQSSVTRSAAIISARPTRPPGAGAEPALASGLGVIYCVGEVEAERERGATEEVLRRQLSVRPHERLVVAYEPVWAIGTGKTATPEQAQEAHAFIKSLLRRPGPLRGLGQARQRRRAARPPDVDGALVGGASLEVDSFTAICQTAAQCGPSRLTCSGPRHGCKASQPASSVANVLRVSTLAPCVLGWLAFRAFESPSRHRP